MSKSKIATSLIEEALGEIEDMKHNASCIEYSAREAERALDKILKMTFDTDKDAIEAARLGLPAMIAKYGHSSKEVQAVEKFISPKP